MGGGNSLTEDIKKYILSNPSFWKNTKNRFFITDAGLRKALKEEIEAQMQRYIELGCTLMHIDSHHHRHVDLSILMLVIPLAKKYGFKTMRISRNVGSGLNGAKRILKGLINSIIRNNFETTDYFCGYRIFKSLTHDNNKSIEVEVHPSKKENQYVDAESGVKDGKYNVLETLKFSTDKTQTKYNKL